MSETNLGYIRPNHKAMQFLRLVVEYVMQNETGIFRFGGTSIAKQTIGVIDLNWYDWYEMAATWFENVAVKRLTAVLTAKVFNSVKDIGTLAYKIKC